MIIPQSSPCLFARHATTLILSNYLREAIETHMNRTVNRQEDEDINILVVKRSQGRRYVHNFDEMYNAIVDIFMNNTRIKIDVFDGSGGPQSVNVGGVWSTVLYSKYCDWCIWCMFNQYCVLCTWFCCDHI
eukprot:849034_1